MLKIVSLLVLLLFHNSAYAEQVIPAPLTEARSLIEQGKGADAINKLRQLLGRTPDHFKAWFLLGVTQARQRRFQAAINSFNKVIALQPQLAEPHNNLAVIYNELGNFRAAVKELEASLALKPDYTTAQENIGDLYVKLAAEAYRRALERDGHPELRQRYERLLHIRDARQPHAVAGKKNVQTARVKVTRKLIMSSGGSHGAVENHLLIPKKLVATARAMVSTRQDDAIKSALAAMEAWRAAWSRQNVSAYFTAYSPAFDFEPRFKTLAQWKHYKQRVITKRIFIKVRLENIKATQLPGGDVRLIFQQYFRSNAYSSDDIKQLLLRHTQHGWKIIREITR